MPVCCITAEFEFKCLCGYVVRNGTEKGLKLMEKLHSKKCDEYENKSKTYQNEYTKINRNGGRRTTNLVFDNRAEFDAVDNRFIIR
jgi:hypothetical protein